MAEHTSNKLTGTWKLLSASSKALNGEYNESPYGPNPTGLLTYTGDGRVASVISYGGREPLPITGGTIEDQASAFKTCLAYAGSYTLRGDKVVHHVEVSSIQNYVNRDLVRDVKFEDDCIVLVTPPTPVNGKIQCISLTWQRLSADV